MKATRPAQAMQARKSMIAPNMPSDKPVVIRAIQRHMG